MGLVVKLDPPLTAKLDSEVGSRSWILKLDSEVGFEVGFEGIWKDEPGLSWFQKLENANLWRSPTIYSTSVWYPI